MKKRITVISFLVSLIVMNINGQERKNEFRITTSYDLGLKKGSGGVLSLNPEFGHYFSDQLFLGVGSGVSVDDKFNSVSIPVFAHAEINFPSKSVTPFVSLKAGYDIATGENQGCARINPSFGVKVPLSAKTDLSLGCGYTRTIADGGGSDLIGFNLGINFDTQGKGLSNFLKTWEYSAELETYTGLSEEGIDYNGHPEEDKISSLYGFRINVLIPVINNLYVGPSIGIGRYTEEHIGHYSTDKFSEMYFSAMLRTEYKIKQLMFADKFYPFVHVDLGYGDYARGDGFFSVNPAAGVAYSVTDNCAAYLSVGYYKLEHFDLNGGSARIALGFQF